MNKRHTTQSAFFNWRILIAVLFCAVTTCFFVSRPPLLASLRPEASTKDSPRTLTFDQRVAYQRAIEEVYWRHRIWPEGNAKSKPSLDVVLPTGQIEKKVESYLRDSQALEAYWQKPITSEQLQAEMDRMAEHTKQPEVLRELFDALGNDPFVIAECLARPVLSERLKTSFAQQERGNRLALSQVGANSQTRKLILANANYTLPAISDMTTGCIPETWTTTSTANAPDARSFHTAVWTGSEMIVWGGDSNTGGRYDPSTDTWIATSTTNAPSARYDHTAVWTGSEMIVWGGQSLFVDTPKEHVAPEDHVYLNTGGQYNPSTDTWRNTSTTDAPDGRWGHTAVWTGSEMIVWGGREGSHTYLDTGGRYNPNTNSWTATSTTNAPDARAFHTAVLSESEMIVWGGQAVPVGTYFNTGGRYNPITDTWTATNSLTAPSARSIHTAVWTGNEMIVWGGTDGSSNLDTGGRYNPNADSWAATSTTNAPEARDFHTAVSTGTEMIVWGGEDSPSVLNTGGRYDPSTDSWTATSTTNAPTARYGHTAVWTGSEMITWGGLDANGVALNTGGRYCSQSGAATPTPTPTATATPTATPTPTASPTATFTPTPTPTPTPCTGRCEPTPRPRPTPVPRP
jgi:N-acetylneuraminic acid mutarotase